MSKKKSHNLYILSSKKILLIVLFLCLICAYLFWRELKFKEQYTYKDNKNTITETIFTPTVLPTVTIAESELLKKIKLAYNKNMFKIQNGFVYKVNTNEQVPALVLTNVLDNTELLKIIDMSSFHQDITNLNEVVYLIPGGADSTTTLRRVTIEGKVYVFRRAIYGEGHPTTENCYQGGEVDGDYFYMKEQKIGVLVKTNKHEEGCKGTEPTVTLTPDKQTLEEVLKVVESIMIQ
jgi:hypothetical protein